MRKKRMIQVGGNIFTDAWDGVKSAGNFVYKKALVPAHDFVKKNKVISRVANLIPDPRAKAVGTIAGQLGYGRKQRGGAKFRTEPLRSVAGTGKLKF